jgi:hypothetical protein
VVVCRAITVFITSESMVMGKIMPVFINLESEVVGRAAIGSKVIYTVIALPTKPLVLYQ